MSSYETLRHLLRSGHFDDRAGEVEGEKLLRIETANAMPAGRLTPDEAQALLLELRLRRIRAGRPESAAPASNA